MNLRSHFFSMKGFVPCCCYPTSGRMTATISGSLPAGSASVDFQSTCGSAIVTYEGVANTITLALCE